MSVCWHILGAGSMGCLWGALLQLAEQPATLLLRDRRALEMLASTGGVRLSTRDREDVVPLDGEPTGRTGPPIHNLLVTTKAHQVLPALESLGSRLGPTTRIVQLHNGMGVAEHVSARLPEVALVVGTTTEGAWRRERFHITHAGRGSTWLGWFRGQKIPPPADLLASLRATGLEVGWDCRIARRLWHKLAVNCAVNPLTALLDRRNGELLACESGKRLARAVCREVEAVLQAESISLDAELWESVTSVLRATAQNYSSMHQDLRRGRATEIDHINGFLVKRAQAHGLTLPVNALLADMIRCREGTRGQRP